MKHLLLVIIIALLFSVLSHGQATDTTRVESDFDRYQKQFEPNTQESFKIKTGMWLGTNTPQKYGADVDLFFGKFVAEYHYSDRLYSTYRGVKLSAGIYRGGYRYSVGYFDFASFVSRAGYSLSATYLTNNSFARFRESTDLVGLQIHLNLMFQIRFGVYREINGGKVIPMFGVGLPIGPNMYRN